MSKKSQSQIRENIRNEVARQFNEKVKNLQSLVKIKNEEISQLAELLHKTSQELCELKSKHEMQEEWIERMQDFCNMSEDDRKEFIEQQKTKHRLDKNVSAVMDMYSRVFSF